MKKSTRVKWTVPLVHFPTEKVPQADGSVIIRAGKAVVVADDVVGTSEAARILGMSRRWVDNECDIGHFKTAHKLGVTERSHWKIARAEVLGRKGIKP
jgi:hypothetical protein